MMRSIWSIQKPAISVIKFKSILQYQFFISFNIYFRKYKILIDIFFPIRIKKNVRDTLKNIFQIIRTKHHLFLELATKHHFPKSHNHQRMSGSLYNTRICFILKQCLLVLSVIGGTKGPSRSSVIYYSKAEITLYCIKCSYCWIIEFCSIGLSYPHPFVFLLTDLR